MIEKFFGKIVLKSSDLVIGGNQNCLDFGLNNGAKINKSTIFPVGKLIYKDHLVPKDQRDLNEIFAHSTAKYHFIYVGRMLDVKFSEDVLLAFEIMYKANSECALIMAGDGDMKKELENRSLEMKISDRVFFLGNVSQKNLCNILAGCFAGFSPLTGRSLIEVSLASLPIVAYEQDWHRDFITRRGAGILVPFRNWQAMAQAALELIDKPEETKKLAEASRLTGLDFCDTDKLYVHEQNEFNKLLKK